MHGSRIRAKTKLGSEISLPMVTFHSLSSPLIGLSNVPKNSSSTFFGPSPLPHHWHIYHVPVLVAQDGHMLIHSRGLIDQQGGDNDGEKRRGWKPQWSRFRLIHRWGDSVLVRKGEERELS